MSETGSGISTDYNAGRSVRSPLRGCFVPLALGVVGFVVVHPMDLRIFEALRGLEARLPSDLRREWFAWQQYGQGVAIGFTALLLWTLAPRLRRRLLDLGLAVAAAQAVSTIGKMLVGRPRPRPDFMDPGTFLGPFGVYPIRVADQWRLVHAWETSRGAGADLWSMPSSHALFAAMFSAFLASILPAAGWLFVLAAIVVGLARVVFGAHWPSDVVVGWAVGYAIGSTITRNGLGVRLLDRIWIRFVDRAAKPAWPVLRAASPPPRR
ncbi:MAG: phosphatase PAP2 family protein [Phycisphaerales bacterium]